MRDLNARPVDVGMPMVSEGATIVVGSDCYPCTIIKVSKTGRTVTLQNDDYQLVLGSSILSENQQYVYRRNPNGAQHVARLTSRRGRLAWRTAGLPVTVGVRRAYRDPSV